MRGSRRTRRGPPRRRRHRRRLLGDPRRQRRARGGSGARAARPPPVAGARRLPRGPLGGRGRRRQRQDDDLLDARLGARRRRARPVVRRRRRHRRARHQCRDRRGPALRRRGGRERRVLPRLPARARRRHERPARPPRLLRHFERCRGGLRGLRRQRRARAACSWPAPTTRGRALAGALAAAAAGRSPTAWRRTPTCGSSDPRRPRGRGAVRGRGGRRRRRHVAAARPAACPAGTTCSTRRRPTPRPWTAWAPTPTGVLAGLAAFRGARRRFETRGAAGGVRVIDDYAHNPGKVAALVRHGRGVVGRAGHVVFQPHLFSRTRDFADGVRGRPGAGRRRRAAGRLRRPRGPRCPGVTERRSSPTAAGAQPAGPRRGRRRRRRPWPRWSLGPRPGDLVLAVGAGDVTGWARARSGGPAEGQPVSRGPSRRRRGPGPAGAAARRSTARSAAPGPRAAVPARAGVAGPARRRRARGRWLLAVGVVARCWPSATSVVEGLPGRGRRAAERWRASSSDPARPRRHRRPGRTGRGAHGRRGPRRPVLAGHPGRRRRQRTPAIVLREPSGSTEVVDCGGRRFGTVRDVVPRGCPSSRPTGSDATPEDALTAALGVVRRAPGRAARTVRDIRIGSASLVTFTTGSTTVVWGGAGGEAQGGALRALLRRPAQGRRRLCSGHTRDPLTTAPRM